MFKFPFSASRVGKPADLGLDFHSHLVPGVDDGVSDLAEARRAIQALRDAGYSGAVVTPHIFRGIYDNTAAGLSAAFAVLLAALGDETETFSLHLGAEYQADEHLLDLIKRNELLAVTVGQERWVLVEFPGHQDDGSTSAICVAALAARGYKPVIAHIERYPYVAKGRTVWLNRLSRAGAILQADLGSLVGQYGDDARRFAHWLMERDLIRVWGSDLHKPEQMARFITPALAQLAPRGRLNPLLDALAVPAAALS